MKICSIKRLCNDEKCKTCYEKSFASDKKSKYWNYVLNDKLPRQVFKYSAPKRWFNCEKCLHSFNISLNRKRKKEEWCPYCSSKKLCINEKCNYCFNKSFSSFDKNKVNCWNFDINSKTPRQVFKYSTTNKYWFKCNICNHNFNSNISNITSKKRWCPYCSNQKLCFKKECLDCYKKSFQSSENVKQWNFKLNKTVPRLIFKYTKKKHWIICEKCKNNYFISIQNFSNGNRCNKCKNKTEKYIFNFLINKYEVKIQHKFEWCKNNKTKNKYPFDFLINKTIIECDGKQHFNQVSNWKSPEQNILRDNYKMKCALENGYSVVRIYQEDVWLNKNNWKEYLLKSIEICKDNSFIIIQKENENLYKNHYVENFEIKHI